MVLAHQMMLPDKIRIGAYQRTVLFPGSGQVFVPEADTIEVDIRADTSRKQLRLESDG